MAPTAPCIYIIDNGRDYSAHTIEFVRVPEGKRAEVDEVITEARSLLEYEADDTWSVVGVVAELDWRKPDAFTEADDFIANVRHHVDFLRRHRRA